MELHRFTLPNGIRVIHCPQKGTVSHCGLFIDAGSRDELPEEHGTAHFIEHTIFKGTTKRNVVQLLNRLEDVGADLNAFTTKEETCIHASFLSRYYERTLELFSDIFFHSRYPEEELARERQVVVEEIRSYHDTPAEQIFDDFEDLHFSGHPLGRNILGTAKSLKKITRQTILEFIRRNYRPERMVIASCGDITPQRLQRLIVRYFSEQHAVGEPLPRTAFIAGNRVERVVKRRNAQVHCVVGGAGYRFADERRVALALLNNMLGGPVMNSRLSLALRERRGLTYHVESNYTAYSDSGIVTIYFGSDPQRYTEALAVLYEELRRLRTREISGRQLFTIKQQLSGQLAIASESNLAVMMSMGKSLLIQDHYEPMESLLMQIDKVSAQMLVNIANDIFGEDRLSMLTFKP